MFSSVIMFFIVLYFCTLITSTVELKNTLSRIINVKMQTDVRNVPLVSL